MSTDMNETQRRNLRAMQEALASIEYAPSHYSQVMQLITTIQDVMRRGGSEDFTFEHADKLLARGVNGQLAELLPDRFGLFKSSFISPGVYLFDNDWGVTVRFCGKAGFYRVDLITANRGCYPCWVPAAWPDDEKDPDWDNRWESPAFTEFVTIVEDVWRAIVPERCLHFLMEVISNFNLGVSHYECIDWKPLPRNAKPISDTACRFTSSSGKNDIGLKIQWESASVTCDIQIQFIQWDRLDGEEKAADHEYTLVDKACIPLEKFFPMDCIKLEENAYRVSPSTYTLDRIFRAINEFVTKR